MKNWLMIGMAALGFTSCGVQNLDDVSAPNAPVQLEFGPPAQYAIPASSFAQKVAGGFLGQGLTLTVSPDNFTAGSTSVNVYVCTDFVNRDLINPSWWGCSVSTVSSPGSMVTRTLIVPQFSPRNPNMRVAIYAENYDTATNHRLTVRVNKVVPN
jgi:hypothetical protein